MIDKIYTVDGCASHDTFVKCALPFAQKRELRPKNTAKILGLPNDEVTQSLYNKGYRYYYSRW